MNTTDPSVPADAYVHEGYGDRPWRIGRKVHRTIYDAHDTLIGVMDTPNLARIVVLAVNELDRACPCEQLHCGHVTSYRTCTCTRPSHTEPCQGTVPPTYAICTYCYAGKCA